MRVADYILNYLSSLGIKHVFLITGGAIAFVVDAFNGRTDIDYICFQHEQAAAMAADAYSRLGPGIAATMVTSGPGATNLITGICCSWFDSIPTIHITGQVNTFELKVNSGVRQVGFQETDIIDVVKPITKFAAQLEKAEDIRYLLEKATHIARSGRPGPVVIDIPQNFQRVEVELKRLRRFIPPNRKQYSDFGQKLKEKVRKSIQLLREAKRPMLLAGGGVKIANGKQELLELIDKLKIPVVTSWSGFDLLPYDHDLRVGEIGVYGNRGANFAVQNADVVLSIGSRLDTRQTGGKPETFAREAKLIMVDIDKAELDKRRGLTPYLSIQTDAKEFLQELLLQIKNSKKLNISKWFDMCMVWRRQYLVNLPEYETEKNKVNAYTFVKALSDELGSNAIIIPDDGGHLTWTMQAFQLKKGQILFSAYGNSPMGYAFPAAIGASIALGKKPIVCIDGDGSFQLNIQELQTVVYNKLPIKIFVLNNKGYGIIKQFQELYLGSRFEASGRGYSYPDFVKIGEAYGITSIEIRNHKEMKKKIKKVLAIRGPVICNVHVREDQKIIPKLEFGKPIEDLSPRLSNQEFKKNMIIKPLGDWIEKEAGV